MSEENVEIVRATYAAATIGDRERIRTLLPTDFVVDLSRRHMDGYVLTRDDAIARFFGQLEEAWDGLPAWQPEELIEGADRLAALVRVVARGKIGGVEVETLVWNVWTFREGLPVALTYFGDDRAAAFAEAGLQK